MSTDLIKLTPLPKPKSRILLPTNLHFPARTGTNFQVINPPNLPVDQILNSRFLVLDFETRGVDYQSEECYPVGVALAWDVGSCYIPLSGSSYVEEDLLYILNTHPRLIAHNIVFDAGWARRVGVRDEQWYICTYAGLAHTANEYSGGGNWGLKDSMREFLGWEDTNEKDLDYWLITNNYYRSVKLNLDKIVNKDEWLWLEDKKRYYKADKGEMWRAPVDILGKYSVLDAEATYLLLTEILLPVIYKFPSLLNFLTGDFLKHTLLHVDQKLLGIRVDVGGFEKLLERRRLEIADIDKLVYIHSETADAVLELERELVEKTRSEMQEPSKYKLVKTRTEPNKLTSRGEVSKNWLKWQELQNKPPELNKNWIKWNKKIQDLHLTEKFNPQSAHHIRRLFYEILEYPVRILTEGDLPSTSANAISKFGEVGLKLVERIGHVKEIGYIKKYLKLSKSSGRMHPSFLLPGAATGRLSGKNPNLHQCPKTKEFLGKLHAEEGYSFVDLDFSAVESVVAGELSGDPNLHFLYGANSVANDVHIFIGAQIPGSIGDKIRGTGYDPYNPTDETVRRAKKEAKSERNICKTVVYACQFGGGVDRIFQTLEENDIVVPYEAVEEVHRTYWEVFRRLKEYTYELDRERRRTGGILMNGLGRPMCVPEEVRKDCLSRVVQSTAHDILVKYVGILTKLLDSKQIHWLPALVDMHDATTLQVLDSDVEKTKLTFVEALDILNKELGGELPIRGVPTSGKTLADVKEPEN